jgi:hypothetical protein
MIAPSGTCHSPSAQASDGCTSLPAGHWLDTAFAERSHWLVWLRLDPRWKTLRGDPRFAALVERVKYPG